MPDFTKLRTLFSCALPYLWPLPAFRLYHLKICPPLPLITCSFNYPTRPPWIRMSSVPGFWAAGCFLWANTSDIFHRCQSFQERRAALFRPLCLSWTPQSNGEGEVEPTTFYRSMGAGCRLGSAQSPHQGPLQYIYLDQQCIPPFSLCGW